MKNILIVDDHTILREALRALLEESFRSDVECDDAESPESALRLLESNSYEMMILDIAMPKINGMDFLPEVKRRYPQTRVLMLSMYPEEQFALKALKLGAHGYITKQEAADELIAAVTAILGGGRYLSKSFSCTIIEKAINDNKPSPVEHKKLSRREMEILRMLAVGNTLKKVADILGLSIKTVSTYKTRLCSKMGFKNNADIVCYALRNSLH